MKALNTTRLSRRALLRTVGAVGLCLSAPPLLSGCTAAPLPAPAAIPTAATTATAAQSEPAEPTARVKVAFVKTPDRVQGVRQALQLLGPLGLAGQRVLLKPNFNSADPTPGSTHPDVLRTLVEELWAQQASAITVADRSGMGDTRQVMEDLGVFALAKTLKFEPLVLDELPATEWQTVQLPGSHWQQGFLLPGCCTTAAAVVQTCCLKTHRYGGHFTLSLKNSVGLVAKYRPDDNYNYMNELHGSPHQRRLIAEINAAYTPRLIVMDGVEAFVTGGPDSGKQVAANVVLASTDRIAIDAVGVAMLRHFGTTPEVEKGPIFAQEQIARAVELGLGVSGPEQIELVTANAASAAYAAQIEEILRQG